MCVTGVARSGTSEIDSLKGRHEEPAKKLHGQLLYETKL